MIASELITYIHLLTVEESISDAVNDNVHVYSVVTIVTVVAHAFKTMNS